MRHAKRDRMKYRVTIFYFTERGILDVDYDLDDLRELEGMFHNGPGTPAISRIEIMVEVGEPTTAEYWLNNAAR